MAFLSCHSLSVLYALLFLFTVSVYGKPAAFFLAGDSTTATKGGWGDGFLSLLEKPAIGTNHAKNGRTTVSFKQGHWNDVMSNVKKHAGQYQVYVTIQVRTQISPVKILVADRELSLVTMIRSHKLEFPYNSIKTTLHQWQHKSSPQAASPS
jgi:hypothetical protein